MEWFRKKKHGLSAEEWELTNLELKKKPTQFNFFWTSSETVSCVGNVITSGKMNKNSKPINYIFIEFLYLFSWGIKIWILKYFFATLFFICQDMT